MSATSAPLVLPGQAAVFDGPIDHTGMYVMHFAIRRDLDDLVDAVGTLPLDDGPTWDGLRSYWELFDEVLGHHHRSEDDHYWPPVTAAIERRGTHADHCTITGMVHDHHQIDRAMAGCRAGFEAQTGPTRAGQRSLNEAVVELRAEVTRHLDREEVDALPLVSRVMTPEEHSVAEKTIGRAYPFRLVAQLVPWAVHGLDPATRDQVLTHLGPPQRLLLRLTRRRFERWHHQTFHRFG